ncbi:MAG: AAA family ATPase [Bacteroidota bacterium]
MAIIAVANHKGGVGKTTSVQNIGVALTHLGKKVLLVDLDPQANLSDAFGYEDVEHSIYDAMTDKAKLPIVTISEKLDLIPSSLDLSVAEIELSTVTGREYILRDLLKGVAANYDYVLIDCPPSLGLLTDKAKLPIVTISEKLDLIPSSLDLSVAEIELSTVTGREYILRDLLKGVAANYDYVLIDCPPSLGLLTVNALTASEEVYIPLDAQYFSMKGLDKLMFIINQIRKRLNKSVEISGVFLTQYDSRIVVNRNVGEMIEETFPNRVFKTRIRRNVALVEGPIDNKDIFSYDANSNGARDYMALAREIDAVHEVQR